MSAAESGVHASGPDDEPSITIHSSWRGVLGGLFGAGLVAAAGTYGVAAAGFRPIPGTLFVVGWLLVLVVALDYPVASTFTSSGVRRHMMLRRQQFRWKETDVLSRTRPSIVRIDRTLQHGGLTLRTGRRTYLLVDRAESEAELDRMIDVVDQDGSPGAEVGASRLPRPTADTPPTWLYRRHHWRPNSAEDR